MNTTADRRFYVYAYFRKDGTPYYVGKGQGRRVDKGWGRCSKLPPKDRRKILMGGLTEPEAFEYEVALIHCLGRKDLGTGCLRNLTDGGDGASGAVVSPETRARLSAANRNPSPKTRAKISAAGKGRVFTPETRSRISAALKGRNRSPEHRAKLSAANRNRACSAETRAKRSAAAKGRVRSPEHQAKINAANRNPSPETRTRLSAAAAAREAAKRAQREALRGQLSLPLQGAA